MTEDVLVSRVGAATVSYRVSGDGPAVVLLHSGPGRSADWTAVSERFASGYRLIAVDGPGQGRTSGWPAGEVHLDVYAALVAGLARKLGSSVALEEHLAAIGPAGEDQAKGRG